MSPIDKRYAKWMEELSKLRDIPIRWNNTQEGDAKWARGGSCRWSQLGRETPKHGGVYVFWWPASGAKAASRFFRGRTLHFKGPAGKDEIILKVTPTFLGTAENGYVPVYVGKSFSSIAGRIGKHLNLKSERVVAPDLCNSVSKRKTTTNQVRDRLDRLFPEIEDTRELLSELRISWVNLCGENHFSERFFLEDLAIGRWRPLFNLDSER